MLTVIIMAALAFIFVLVVFVADKNKDEEFGFGATIFACVASACIAAAAGIIIAWLLGFASPKELALRSTTKLYPIDKNIYLRVASEDGGCTEYAYSTKNRNGEILYQNLKCESKGQAAVKNENKNPVLRRYTVVGKGAWKYFAFVVDMGREKFYIPAKSAQYGFDFKEENEVE